MRVQSAAIAKNGWNHSNMRPREGSKLRETYDLLMSNKGVTIDINLGYLPGHLYQLMDYYGLDIRMIKRGRWVLAGEWFGTTYVDYIADRIK